ncbi:hypothetical protein ANO11243_048630 [Dothideomycetidae sp. 11243]|nr:hypothetical protein ANO11243_048630 [fungal sp. No.11243]
MPRRQFIDKKSATTFALVHRAQNDPLIHSSDAPQMVFAEIGSSSRQPPGQSKKVKERGDLEEEFGMAFRKNEGQAAEYGVFYDDTEYDYMQHLRDLGSGEGGEVAWVPATATGGKKEKKGKGKQKLEDALAGIGLDDVDDAASEGGISLSSRDTSASQHSLLPDDMLPSEFVKKQTYQDQQDIPDAIAGFQPDMDPRLREVLEALEDDAYVDDEEDIFAELQGDGEEVDEDEFYDQHWDRGRQSDSMARFLQQEQADDDGWESDDTIKADNEPAQPVLPVEGVALPPADPNATPAADPSNGAWMSEFSKFKSTLKDAKGVPSQITGDRSMLSSLAAGRTKKRKGAKTSTTNYSMTSSALARTDPQTLLDARFDKLMESYDAEDYGEEGQLDSISEADDMSLASGVSGISRASRFSKTDSIASGISRTSRISTYSRMTDSEAPQLVRSDFDNIMDSFLGTQTSKGGKSRRDIGIAPGRKGKRGVHGEGLKELDEIRKGLGKARIEQRAG